LKDAYIHNSAKYQYVYCSYSAPRRPALGADVTVFRLGIGEYTNHAEENALDWPDGKASLAALYSSMRRPARTLPPDQDHAFYLRTQGETHITHLPFQ